MKPFKLVLFTVLQVLVTTLVVGAFFGLPYAIYVCKTQPGLSITFGIVLVLSFVFGRYFCQALCPLGAIQDLVTLVFHPRTKVRRVCSRLPRSKAQRIVNCTILLVAGCGVPFGMLAALNPYGIFGRFVSLFVPATPEIGTAFLVSAVGVFALVVITAAFGRGRFWCNWICPMGTIFDDIARCSYFKDKPSSRCAHCRKCFPPSSSTSTSPSTSAITRRETMKGVALLAVAEKLTDGGYAAVSRAASPSRVSPVLPPGALWGQDNFDLTCVGCQLCVTHCPGKCLKPISWSGQVGLDFRDGYCIQDCVKCAEVCPMGAMKKLTVLEKRNVHVGVAQLRIESCLRTKGEKCQACVRKCPVKALHLVGNSIAVDVEACVGCGACEHVCAARPEPAIVVEGLFRQRAHEPMGEADLLAEMKGHLEKDATLVVAREGVIRVITDGHGIADTLELLDDGKFYKATVCDKVVGRAAAAVFIAGRAKKVWAKVMGEDALALLKKHGVDASAEKMVKGVLNKDLSDRCPLEKAADGTDDPKQIVKQVRKQQERMKAL